MVPGRRLPSRTARRQPAGDQREPAVPRRQRATARRRAPERHDRDGRDGEGPRLRRDAGAWGTRPQRRSRVDTRGGSRRRLLGPWFGRVEVAGTDRLPGAGDRRRALRHAVRDAWSCRAVPATSTRHLRSRCESPPDGKHAAFLMPVEGDRWILTIGAGFGAPRAFRRGELPCDRGDAPGAAGSRPGCRDRIARTGFRAPAAVESSPALRTPEASTDRVHRARRFHLQLQPGLRAGHEQRSAPGRRARRVPRAGCERRRVCREVLQARARSSRHRGGWRRARTSTIPSAPDRSRSVPIS